MTFLSGSASSRISLKVRDEAAGCLPCFFPVGKGCFAVRIFLCLLLSLFVGLMGFGAEKKIPPSSSILPLTPISSSLYFAVAAENPGSVYRFNVLTNDISVFYTRSRGQLYSFVFHPGIPEKLYYVNANDKGIFLVTWLGDRWTEEAVVYEHTTYVRDIAFGPEPVTGTPAPGPRLRLFFSEATGAGGGKIYYLDSRNRPVLFYKVHKRWAGDFAFDEDGNLYFSSGNVAPGRIYKAVDGGLEVVLTHREPIKGFVVRGGKVYFANWRGSIYVVDLSTGEVEEIFKNPQRFRWLSDVGFRD